MTLSLNRQYILIVAGVILVFVISLLSIYQLLWQPHTLPATTFEVAPGSSVQGIAQSASDLGYIRSANAFLIVYRLQYHAKPIEAGRYQLPTEASLLGFLRILVAGDTEEPYTAITFPEGITTERMAAIIREQAVSIDTETYTELLKDREGYAFPDTYYVGENTTAEDLVHIQTKASEEVLKSVRNEIATHVLNEYEIITLASIIEREANDESSMKMVSGILQNRLRINMPLQADASIEYVLDKPLSLLTPEDLQIKSPYNTYQNRGLPPTPINNPGTVAIDAVLNPTPSDYLYYITGRDGNFYYAETLQQHNQNINQHLR